MDEPTSFHFTFIFGTRTTNILCGLIPQTHTHTNQLTKRHVLYTRYFNRNLNAMGVILLSQQTQNALDLAPLAAFLRCSSAMIAALVTRAPRALTREALLFIWACAKVVSIRVCQKINLNVTISKLLVLVSMSGLSFGVYINNISALV